MVLILNYMASDNSIYHPRFQHAGKIRFLFLMLYFKKTNHFLIILMGTEGEKKTHTVTKLKFKKKWKIDILKVHIPKPEWLFILFQFKWIVMCWIIIVVGK